MQTINNVDAIWLRITDLVPHKATKAWQISCHTRNSHNSTLSWSIAPWFVVTGKHTQMTASNCNVELNVEFFINFYLTLFPQVIFQLIPPRRGSSRLPPSRIGYKIFFAPKLQSPWSKGKHSWLWIWRPRVRFPVTPTCFQIQNSLNFC